MDEPLTITAAAPLIRSGELTPSELLEQCLRRIDIYEPAVKAWVYLDRERARRDAAMATEQIRAGNYLGELHGIPIGIKDIIDVFDMPTGCGSKLWANSYARKDATCVERLRRAGAILLGKTVTTPYAFTDPPITRNPWNLERTPGGSSSGSAAAVACGMCLAALGTQTGGSLTRPASYCGVCSLKPSYGRVSVEGVLPLAPSLDHVGVMANCVRDLAVVFEAMAESGHFVHFPFTMQYSGITDLVDDLDSALQPLATIGHFPSFFDVDLGEQARWVYRNAKNHINAAVHATEEISALPPDFGSVLSAHRDLMAIEAAWTHRGRFERHPEDYPSSISKLIQEGKAHSGIRCRTTSEFSGRLSLEFESIHRNRVYCTPAASDFAPTPETTGDPRMNVPWSFTGLPTVSFPVGWSMPEELPISVQMSYGRGREKYLLAVAIYLEKKLGESIPNLKRRLPPVPV